MNIDNLSPDALWFSPLFVYGGDQDFNYSWESHQCVECPECGGEFVSRTYDEECPHCDCVVATCAEGPMMNYFYPLPGEFDDQDALKLSGLPLCLVVINHATWGLALTGGGQDLSWGICEAYMRLGYLPPLHFTRLPNLAGKEYTDRNKAILEACEGALRVSAQWGALRKDQLEAVRNDLVGNTNTEAFRKAEYMLDFKPGWGGNDDSVAISKDTFDRAMYLSTLIETAYIKQTSVEMPALAVSPCENGSIDLYWSTPMCTLLINVPPAPNECPTYSCMAGAKFEKVIDKFMEATK